MTGMAYVLLLLTFGALSEAALNCYQCPGICDGSNEVVQDCLIAEVDRCIVLETSGQKQKSCSLQLEWFDCLQEKLGQSGDCVRSTVGEVEEPLRECSAPPKAISDDNSTNGRKPNQNDRYVFCLCAGNLCNTDDLLEGDNGGEGSSTPGGGEDSSTSGGQGSSTAEGENSSTPGDGGEDGSGTIGMSAVVVAISGLILLITNRLFI